ncbi:MAG: TMEM175 family protein [Rhodoblastus sp.]|uniref:TMEM175 family protein n=2 Tax=Rhodoblastus sp. TaxID=1962975 RepID=UPI003F94F521
MLKERLTVFSDSVIAIIITIMVLQLKAPHEASLGALAPLAPAFLAYALSFAYIAIYWNNHHHLFQATRRISGGILWANTHLLFWLSLVPFSTAWLSETHFARAPVALYGLSLLAPSIAYYFLSRALIRTEALTPKVAEGIDPDLKGLISMAFYICGVALAFAEPYVSMGLYALVAVIWFIPDPRIEQRLEVEDEPD